MPLTLLGPAEPLMWGAPGRETHTRLRQRHYSTKHSCKHDHTQTQNRTSDLWTQLKFWQKLSAAPGGLTNTSELSRRTLHKSHGNRRQWERHGGHSQSLTTEMWWMYQKATLTQILTSICVISAFWSSHNDQQTFFCFLKILFLTYISCWLPQKSG